MTPKGYSLHVGLRFVDFDRFKQDYSAPGCDDVALKLADIAAGRGFEAVLLRNEEAKKKRVTEEWDRLASMLGNGDFLLVTVAAHGVARVDAADCGEPVGQGLVLFDDYWLDNEIYVLLERITCKARVLLIVESCRSGSIFTAPAALPQFASVPFGSIRRAVDLRRQNLYSCRPKVKANVLLLAASGDHLLAAGTLSKGFPPFSKALFEVLGHSKTYRDLRDNIRSQVAIGLPDPVLNEHLVTNAAFVHEVPLTV